LGKLKVRDNESSKYFSDLEKVYLSGYMREYVWSFITKDVKNKPEKLRESEFSNWAGLNIPNHVPVVNPGIAFK